MAATLTIAKVDGLVGVVAAVAARESNGVEVARAPPPLAAGVLGMAAEVLGIIF